MASKKMVKAKSNVLKVISNNSLSILESPVSMPLGNQQAFVHILLLFLVEEISY